MSLIGHLSRGLVLPPQMTGMTRLLPYLKCLAADISLDSFHTKAQRSVAVRSRYQKDRSCA